MAKIKDPISFTDQFGLPSNALDDYGLLNPVLNVDTKLFIDPVLLRKSKHRQMAIDARADFERHFTDIITLLIASERRGDRAWIEADRRLSFPEISHNCLGYGAGTISGHAIGPLLRGRLLSTAQEIIRLGIKNPDLFLLVPLLEDGFGPDLISDMTTNVIEATLARFTQGIAADLGIETEQFEIGDESFDLPRNRTQRKRIPVLLVPSDVLAKLPVASDWSEVADAAAYSAELKQRVSRWIGDIWSAAVRAERAKLRAATLARPEAVMSALDAILNGRVRPYDLVKDPDGLTVWRKVQEIVARDFPFLIKRKGPPSAAEVIGVVDQIVEQVRHLVEKQGLWKLLWNGLEHHVEKVGQMFFYGIAHSYCKANNLDVSPEADTGSGPVDFKFSSGFNARVLVEIKLSRNPKLIAGYQKQLEAYSASQEPISATYLILNVGGLSDRRLKQLHELQGAFAGTKAKPAPKIVVIDARRQVSASKR